MKVCFFSERTSDHLFIKVKSIICGNQLRNTGCTGSSPHLNDPDVFSVNKYIRIDGTLIGTGRCDGQLHLTGNFFLKCFAADIRKCMANRNCSVRAAVYEFRMRCQKNKLMILHKSIHTNFRSAKEIFDQYIVPCRTISGIFVCFFYLFRILHHSDSAASRTVYALYNNRISKLFCGFLHLFGASHPHAGCSGNAPFLKRIFHFCLIRQYFGRFIWNTGQMHLFTDISDRTDGHIGS